MTAPAPAAPEPLLNVPNLLSLARVPLAVVLFACVVRAWWLAGLLGVLLIQWWRAEGFSPSVLGALEPVQLVLLWAMLAATVGSGVQYVVKAAKLLR